MSSEPRRALAVPIGAGVVVSSGLALYAAVHDPTGRGLAFVSSTSVDDVKRVLTAVAVVALLAQIALGLRLVARAGPAPAAGQDDPHAVARQVERLLGTVAFACTIPVAFHCLWALGAQGGDLPVLLHSTFGIVGYGVWTARTLAVRAGPAAAVAVPGLGVALGMAVVIVAATAT